VWKTQQPQKEVLPEKRKRRKRKRLAESDEESEAVIYYDSNTDSAAKI